MSGPAFQPLRGVRIVELTGLASAYGTRLLAALGAEVIVAEPPGGHPLRSWEPFAPGVAHPEASLWWAYLAQAKKSVVAEGADLANLVASAAVVVAPHGPPAELDPKTIWVAITPFGLSGPRRDWKGSELVAWASSGLLDTVGFPDQSPVVPGGPVQLAHHFTSMQAALGVQLALRAAKLTGRGQLVDISMQECATYVAPETGLPLFLDDRVPRPRPGNRRAVTRPWGLYACQDGFVSFLVLQPAHWRAMARWLADELGEDALLDPVFEEMAVRWEAADYIDATTEALTGAHTKLELFQEGQRRGIPITPVNTVADLRADPHLAASGFWRVETHPAIGELAGPGAPFRVNHDWWQWTAAPLLGQHTAEVMGSR